MTNEPVADITERLCRAAMFMRGSGKGGLFNQHPDACDDAAEEIARLRKIAELMSRAGDKIGEWDFAIIGEANELAIIEMARLRNEPSS